MYSKKEYKEHLVAFIDLVGFKDAILQGRQDEILELLQLFSTTVGSFKSTVKIFNPATLWTIQPSISIFSDNIVLSIPICGSIPEHVLLDSLAQCIAWIAANALEKGFLIRGGVAKGPLYHKNNIVFGEAFIEAYQLESQLANYPRVLLSRNIDDFVKKYRHSIFVDFDGLNILNFIEYIIRAGLPEDQNLVRLMQVRMTKFDNVISNTIQKLSIKNKFKELSKWIWFLKHYDTIKDREQKILQEIIDTHKSNL